MKMQCKQVRRNFIGLIEKSLPEPLSSDMFDHIDSCKECKGSFNNILATYTAFDGLQEPEINPFFYTRLQQKLISKEKRAVNQFSLIKMKLIPVAISLSLAIGISFGILMGKNLASFKMAKTEAIHKTMLDAYASEYYLNETAEENLNVILTNE
jgi:hypothetical protein